MEETSNVTRLVPSDSGEKRGCFSPGQTLSTLEDTSSMDSSLREENDSVTSPCRFRSSSGVASSSSVVVPSLIDSLPVEGRFVLSLPSSLSRVSPLGARPGSVALRSQDASFTSSRLRKCQASSHILPTVHLLSRLLVSMEDGTSLHSLQDEGISKALLTRLRLVGATFWSSPFAHAFSNCPSPQVAFLSPPLVEGISSSPAVVTPEAALACSKSVVPPIPVASDNVSMSSSFFLSPSPSSFPFASFYSRPSIGDRCGLDGTAPSSVSCASRRDSENRRDDKDTSLDPLRQVGAGGVSSQETSFVSFPATENFFSPVKSLFPMRVRDYKAFQYPSSFLSVTSPGELPPSVTDASYVDSSAASSRLHASSKLCLPSSYSRVWPSSIASFYRPLASLASVLSYPLLLCNRDGFPLTSPTSSSTTVPSSPSSFPSPRSPSSSQSPASQSHPPAWPAGPLRFFPAFPVHRCRGVSVTLPPNGEKVCFGQFEETAGILLLSPEQLDGLAVASKSPFFDGFVLRHLSPSIAALDARRKAAAVLAAAAKLGKGGTGNRVYEGDKQNESSPQASPFPEALGRRKNNPRGEEEGTTPESLKNTAGRSGTSPRPANEEYEDRSDNSTDKLPEENGTIDDTMERRAKGGASWGEVAPVKTKREGSVFSNENRGERENEEVKVIDEKKRGQRGVRAEDGGGRYVRGGMASSTSSAATSLGREGGEETVGSRGERPSGLKTLDRLEGVLTRAEDLAPLIAGESQCSLHGRLVQFSQGKKDDWNLCIGDCYWLAMKIPLQSCNPFIFFKNEAIVKIDTPNAAAGGTRTASRQGHQDSVRGTSSSHVSEDRGSSSTRRFSSSQHSQSPYHPQSPYPEQPGSYDPSHPQSGSVPYSPSQQPQYPDSPFPKKPYPPYHPSQQYPSSGSPYRPGQDGEQPNEESQLPGPRYPSSYSSPVQTTNPSPNKHQNPYSPPPGSSFSPGSRGTGPRPWTPEDSSLPPHSGTGQSNDFPQNRGDMQRPRDFTSGPQDGEERPRGVEPSRTGRRPDGSWVTKPGPEEEQEETADDVSSLSEITEWLTNEAVKRYKRVKEAAPEAFSRAAERLKDNVPQSTDDAVVLGKRCAEFPQWAFQYVTDAARQLGGSMRQAAVELWNFIFTEGGGGGPGTEGGGKI